MVKAIKLVNFVLLAGGIFWALGLIFVIYAYDLAETRHFTSQTGQILYHALPAALGIFFFASLRLRPAHKANLVLLLLSSVLSLYAVEIFLSKKSATWFLEPAVPEQAKAAGVKSDRRNKLEVIDDLRGKAIDAYLTGNPKILLKAQSDGGLKSDVSFNGAEALPLGWVSKRVVVFCNENGYWVNYQSDERGFHNPKGIWKNGRVDIAAVGDSFTHGYCVPSDKNFVALIRRQYPATLNLGMSGNGPLLLLAGIEEYLRFVKPKTVLWFYAEVNDLCDLKVEKHSSLLMRYRTGSFTQGLLAKQAEIDSAIYAYVNSAMAGMRLGRLLGILKLRGIREKAGLIYATTGNRRRTHFEVYGCKNASGAFYPDTFVMEETDFLGELLAQARDSVSGWGGRLYFVYLPEWQRYNDPEKANPYRDQVLAVVRSAGIPIIDVHETFRAQSDPLSLFPFRQQGHYNVEGHRVTAETVLRSIRVGAF